jgi:hypothetical protein
VPTNTEILSSGVWHFSDYTHWETLNTTYWNDLPDCRKDDQRIFNSDGTGEMNEGPTKCDSTDPQSQSVKWKFLNSTADKIEMNGVDYIIDQLDAHEFKFHTQRLDPYDDQTSYGYSK